MRDAKGIRMQTFGLNYDVKPECVEDFQKTLMELIETMKRTDGHVETRLYADVAKPNSMVIYSNWDTKAAFSNFFRSDVFQQKIKDTVNMLESMPTHLSGQNVRLIKPAD